MNTELAYRPAIAADIAECIVLRAKTRENAVSVERLAELGITHANWSGSVADGSMPGYVCLDAGRIVGYCFGDKGTGEIVVLALLPQWEGRGVGKRLLEMMVQSLAVLGFQRLHLACSSNSKVRSHGFYRHLGWKPTGKRFANNDDELEYFPPR